MFGNTIQEFFANLWHRRHPAPPPPPPPLPPKPLPTQELDVPYGPEELQKLDIHRPEGMVEGDLAPCMDMTHGGGWQNDKGDKNNDGVIKNKLAHYLALGYIVITGNYRLWTSTNGITPAIEADDVARKLAFIKTQVAGVDPNRITEIGHSAGANLMAQVCADVSYLNAYNISNPERGICLDGVYDIPMAIRAAKLTGDPKKIALYAPFGDDPTVQRMDSPTYSVNHVMCPMFLAYSTKEGPQRQKQAEQFAAAIVAAGGPEPVVKGYPYTHAEMDSNVGLDNDLTRDIDKFMGITQ